MSNEPLLQVRIGIATGLVVIGEPIGSGDSRRQTAVGETPNLAARLQGLAGPGQVIIAGATRRQIAARVYPEIRSDAFNIWYLAPGNVHLKGSLTGTIR